MTGAQRVLVSCPFSSPWLTVTVPDGWSVRPRPVDLEVGRARAVAARVGEVAALVRSARQSDVLLISTSALELLLLCLARPLFRRCTLVAYDPLQVGNDRLRAAARRLAARIDVVLCVRRSDLAAWAAAGRVEFIPFFAPATVSDRPAAATEVPSVYSAGDAHRDYRLLVDAVRATDLSVTICTRSPLDATHAPRVDVLPAVSPEEGRARQASSGITAVLLRDTPLPAGPLVLLDAMAAGAAIVCTASRGLVDYVDDGVEALVLPPDAGPQELRERLLRLASDRELRERLGRAAQARVRGELAPDVTMTAIERIVWSAREARN